MRKTMTRALGAMLIMSVPAGAIPPYVRFYKEKYGYRPNCSLCHQLKDWRMNGYGDGFEDGGRTMAALAALEDKDADGDGVKNGAEARAKSNPGDPASRPRRLGPWLDEAKILPPMKALNKVFPGNGGAEVLFPDWTPESRAALEAFGDEALFPVVFRVKGADGAVAGSCVYVSFNVPGPAGGTNMVLVSAAASGALADVKFVQQEGDRGVKQEAYLDGFKGRTFDALGAGPAAPKGAEKDAAALTAAVAKALAILREAGR